jgi:general secretion pathway protein G
MAKTRNPIRRAAEAGFTLIELLIVIAVIGLIGTLVATNVMSRFEEAKIKTTRINMQGLGVVLDDFRRVCGFYPTTEQGLDALVKPPVGRECKNWGPDPFLKDGRVPKDAWSNDFMYESEGNKYTIKSWGTNGPGSQDQKGILSTDDQQ